jgi:uncharacterized protein YecA (UPF0149 family)
MKKKQEPSIEDNHMTNLSLEGDALEDATMSSKPDPPGAASVKKNAPCACGSGLRYKKCCLAKQKHAARLERMNANKEVEFHGEERNDPERYEGRRFQHLEI